MSHSRFFRAALAAAGILASVSPAPGWAAANEPMSFQDVQEAASKKDPDAHAQYLMGVIYRDGNYMQTQNYTQAAGWFQKAADQGDVEAEYNLGVAYRRGYGVKQDDTKAVFWYRKAAEKGLADAESNLGVMLSLGRGTRQDYAEAAKWFRKAADQGNVDAQSNLGVAYSLGQGLPKDYVEADVWYALAVAHGHAEAKPALDSVETVMTPAQIETAHTRAMAWKPLVTSSPGPVKASD